MPPGRSTTPSHSASLFVAGEFAVAFPIAGGVGEATLGLFGESEMRFLAGGDGVAALYLSNGFSLGESARLRIEQLR